MTDVLGETQEGVETTRRDPAILPETAINDVDFILSVPVHISVTSGLNALPDAVEGVFAVDRNPLITPMSGEAIAALSGAGPRSARLEGATRLSIAPSFAARRWADPR